MMIGLMVLAMWVAATVSAACLIHVGKRQERPPRPVPAVEDSSTATRAGAATATAAYSSRGRLSGHTP